MDYAQATLPHNSTRFAPIQLEIDYLLYISFNWNKLKGPQTIHEKLFHEEA